MNRIKFPLSGARKLGARKLGALFATLAVTGSLLAPIQSSAVIQNIANGNSQATVDLDGGSGMLNWLVDGQDQLVQQWFWYRIGNGLAQPINTISAASFSNTGDELTTTYQNALLSIQIKYLLTGGTIGSGTADIQETIVMHNFTGSALDFHFYQYSDFNLLGTGGDSVLVDGNGAFQFKGPTQISETVVSPTANHFEAALVGSTLGRLNSVTNLDLNDVGSAGPGDVTWALQWDHSVAAGADFDILKDKLLSLVPIPEPSSLTLLAIGLGLGMWKSLPRRRQNS
jgi:hypothetical protein